MKYTNSIVQFLQVYFNLNVINFNKLYYSEYEKLQQGFQRMQWKGEIMKYYILLLSWLLVLFISCSDFRKDDETHLSKIQQKTEREDEMCDIVIYEEPERSMVAIRLKTPPEEIGKNWPVFAKQVREKQNIRTDGWGIEEHFTTVKGSGEIDYELMLPVINEIQPDPPLFARILPRAKVASILYRGTLNQTGEHRKKLMNWVDQQGLKVCGNMRVVHLRCPHNTSDAKGYVTELQVPIE